MTDEKIAETLRAQVAKLNDILAQAARAQLVVELRQTVHQTADGASMVVVEADVFKRL